MRQAHGVMKYVNTLQYAAEITTIADSVLSIIRKTTIDAKRKLHHLGWKMQWIKAMQFKLQSCDNSSVPHSSKTCHE